MIKECKHCGDDFDATSQTKKRVGGYINECPDCVVELGTETAVRYRGVVDGSGKMAAISIVAFDSQEDADAYVASFNSCGFGRRKTNRCNTINHRHVGFNMLPGESASKIRGFHRGAPLPNLITC